MIFNSKQLEELENIHDSTGAFEEEGEDDGNFEEIGEAAMDWRRGLIEEAAENIKRAKTRPVEPHLTYPVGSMLFEREARRFARVQRSVPGYLKIVYLSGGDREFGTLDVIGYLRDQGAERRLSELSDQLGMNDADVAAELERLGITPIEELEPEEGAEAAAAAEAPGEVPVPPMQGRKGKAAAAVEEEVVADDVAVAGDDAGAGKKGAKPAGKQVAPPPGKPAKGMKAAPPPPASASKLPQKASGKPGPQPAPQKATAPAPSVVRGKGGPAKAPAAPVSPSAKINPIDDPNSYIKAHYQEQSNRELARVTGLSEHTIRRKLGEWGMKRK